MDEEKVKTSDEFELSGIWYGIGAYMAWGFLPLYWKALKQFPPEFILANRVVWSFAFVALILLFNKRWHIIKDVFANKKTIMLTFLGAILVSGNWYTYIWAVNSNKVVEASLGYYINPLLTVFLGMLVLKERLDFWQVIALGLAAAGVLIMTWEYGRLPWVALVLAFSFALYGLVKRLANLDSTIGLALETLFVVPLAALYLFLEGSKGAMATSQGGVVTSILLIGTGIVTAVPLLWFAEGAKRVPFATLGFIQYLSPSISLFLGIFLFREPFTTMHLLSFGFIWSALALYSFSRTKLFVASSSLAPCRKD